MIKNFKFESSIALVKYQDLGFQKSGVKVDDVEVRYYSNEIAKTNDFLLTSRQAQLQMNCLTNKGIYHYVDSKLRTYVTLALEIGYASLSHFVTNLIDLNGL